MDLPNKALEDCGVKQRFILLPPDDQTAGFVFIPPEIYDAAIRVKLIPSHEEVAEMMEELDA
jgi:hypothetical protein